MKILLTLFLLLCLSTFAFGDIYSVGLGSYTDEVPDGLTPYFDDPETPEIEDPQGFPDPPAYVTENVTGVVPGGDW